MIPSGKPSRLSPRLIPLVVFLSGLCSTVVLYQLIVESVDQRQQVYFDFRAREAAERIENRRATYQQVLRGTAGFFDVHDDVGREDFRRGTVANSRW